MIPITRLRPFVYWQSPHPFAFFLFAFNGNCPGNFVETLPAERLQPSCLLVQTQPKSGAGSGVNQRNTDRKNVTAMRREAE